MAPSYFSMNYPFCIYLIYNVAKLNDCVNRKFIIVYADDILLITQSVSELRNLLRTCDFSVKKS